MKLSEIIAKAESLNLVVSDTTDRGLVLIFASACLADQFTDWCSDHDIGTNAPADSPKITMLL